MKSLILGLVMTLTSFHAFADGSGSHGIQIRPLTQGTLNAGTIQYSFDLLDQDAKPLSDQDLTEDHTKKLHFIAYDASLKEFNHVHPIFDGNKWSVELNLPVNGTYFFWAQGQTLNGPEFSTFVNAQIQGGQPEIPVTALGDHRKGSDQGTIVELAGNKLRAGKMAMINFTISREDGAAPEITPYLGAFAHVIAVSPDGSELTHVHPMEGNDPNTGMLHATFPTAGDYRIWIQLNDKGELKTVPLSVTVLK